MVFPLRDKKGIRITYAFQKILDESNKVWVDKGSKFQNRFMKLWFQDNDIKLYSTHNEVECVVAEIFIRTLKNKICKF